MEQPSVHILRHLRVTALLSCGCRLPGGSVLVTVTYGGQQLANDQRHQCGVNLLILQCVYANQFFQRFPNVSILFSFPKVLPKSKVLCLFCLFTCFLLNCALNSPVVKSKLFLVAPVGFTTLGWTQSTQAGRPHLGPWAQSSGSDDMPLPWSCTLRETVPLILRLDPRTHRPASPVLQGRHSRDGAC